MIPWVRLAAATTPGGAELRLMQRGSEFSIMLANNELMNSRVSGSEEALASLAVARVKRAGTLRVLIGGLGMGFTLRSALDVLSVTSVVEVAEIVPEIVVWARGPLAPVFGGCLDDHRVSVLIEDVAATIRRARDCYDLILLDVDNGPDGLTRPDNDGLYGQRGIADAFAALRRGGVLGVWSSGPDAVFTRRLGAAAFEVEEVSARARGRRGSRHVIWLAKRR